MSSVATEGARPVLFGVLIIVAVYLPIFTLQGLEGKMFRPMAITVCSAILGSLLLSLTVVPVAASYLMTLAGGHHEERWFARLRARYDAHLDDAMNHRGRTLAVAGVIVTVAIASIPFLGTEFMPKLDEGSILIETRKLPSVPWTNRSPSRRGSSGWSRVPGGRAGRDQARAPYHKKETSYDNYDGNKLCSTG